MLDLVRGLVRPLVTIGFVGGFIVGAFIDTGAAEVIKDPALMITAYWFGQRTRPTATASVTTTTRSV